MEVWAGTESGWEGLLLEETVVVVGLCRDWTLSFLKIPLSICGRQCGDMMVGEVCLWEEVVELVLVSGRTLHFCDDSGEVERLKEGGGAPLLLPIPFTVLGLTSLCLEVGGKGNGIGGGGLLDAKSVGLKKSLLFRIVIPKL